MRIGSYVTLVTAMVGIGSVPIWGSAADSGSTNPTKNEQPHPGLPAGKTLNGFSAEPYEIRINQHRLMVPMNRLRDITTKNFVSL